MRTSLIICLAILLATVSFGQKELPKPKWEAFSPDNEEFSIQVPTTIVPGTAEREGGEMYSGRLGNLYFYVFSDDASATGSKYSDVVKDLVKQLGGKLEVPRDGSKTYEWKTDDSFGFTQRFRAVRTTKRIYVIQTVDIDARDTAEQFLNSFKILEKKDLTDRVRSKPSLVPRTPSNPSNSGGSGYGSARSGGASATPAQTVPAPVNAGLSILSKPKPGYTDFARFYHIEGTTVLRVTFMLDGTIGAITPTTQLPFGLTEQAKKSAKNMRFRPAYYNGTPFTVTKLVEYSFSIY